MWFILVALVLIYFSLTCTLSSKKVFLAMSNDNNLSGDSARSAVSSPSTSACPTPTPRTVLLQAQDMAALQSTLTRMSLDETPMEYAIRKLKEMLDDPEIARVAWKVNMVMRHIRQLEYIRGINGKVDNPDDGVGA